MRGYVVDVNFCVFDVSVEEFGAAFDNYFTCFVQVLL
jgi:hypothetical protein